MAEVIHTRWAGSDAPAEMSLRKRLEAEGIECRSLSGASGDRYPVQSYDHHTVIYCVEGSIWFMLTDERDRVIELEPGDRLDIPPGVRHSAVVGMDGVSFLEGHAP